MDSLNLFVIHHEDEFYAYLNTCPHKNIPLNWGNNVFLDIDEELIQCSSHGAFFTIESGHCVSGPCAGDSLTPCHVKCIDNVLYFLEFDTK